MATLQCRECGTNIDSNTRQTRCKGCGALFPFACAVCQRQLRPPFPIYRDERHLTQDNEPLCQQHFERQCPRCSAWFQADLNPGYFLCPQCSEENDARLAATAMDAVVSTSTKSSTQRTSRTAHVVEEDTEYFEIERHSRRPGCLGAILFVVSVAVGFAVTVLS